MDRTVPGRIWHPQKEVRRDAHVPWATGEGPPLFPRELGQACLGRSSRGSRGLALHKGFSIHDLVESSHLLYRVNVVIIPTLEMRKQAYSI